MTYSVVITSYNSVDTIERVIKGVCELEPKPVEVLILDDCSTDGSVALIQGLISDLTNFRLIENNTNLGQSYSRNLGVQLSESEIVMFQDDDDISLPSRASIHIQSISDGADFSYVSSLKKYPNGYSVSNINTDISSDDSSSRAIVKHLSVGSRLPFPGYVFAPSSTLAVRRSAFLELNGFRIELRRLEDIELACRALVTKNVLSWSSKLAVERLHTDGNDKSSKSNFLGELQVIESVRVFLSAKEYFVAKSMTVIREAYFSKNKFKLLQVSPLGILLILGSPKKLFSITRRIRHDLKKKL